MEEDIQRYHLSQLFNFADLTQANAIIAQLGIEKLQRFDMWESTDYIVATLGPGVYMILEGRKVVYVGCAKEMRTRVKQHEKKGDKLRPGEWVVTVKTVDFQQAKKLETKLMPDINPVRNKIKGLFGRKYK
jgi:hypothetical protein